MPETIGELEGKIEKLKQQKKLRATLPQPLPTPDFTQLIKTCVSYIADLAKEGYADEDYDHYVFEEALQAIYGKDIFKNWINKVHT